MSISPPLQFEWYCQCLNFDTYYFGWYCLLDKRPPLWPRGNIVTSHAAVRSVSWLRFFPWLSLNRKTNVTKFWTHSPRSSYGHHISSKQYIICLRTATVSDHSCSTWPLLNNNNNNLIRQGESKCAGISLWCYCIYCSEKSH